MIILELNWLCTQDNLHFQSDASVARCTQNSFALEVTVGSHAIKVIGDGILKEPFEIDGFRETLMTIQFDIHPSKSVIANRYALTRLKRKAVYQMPEYENIWARGVR